MSDLTKALEDLGDWFNANRPPEGEDWLFFGESTAWLERALRAVVAADPELLADPHPTPVDPAEVREVLAEDSFMGHRIVATEVGRRHWICRYRTDWPGVIGDACSPDRPAKMTDVESEYDPHPPQLRLRLRLEDVAARRRPQRPHLRRGRLHPRSAHASPSPEPVVNPTPSRHLEEQ